MRRLGRLWIVTTSPSPAVWGAGGGTDTKSTAQLVTVAVASGLKWNAKVNSSAVISHSVDLGAIQCGPACLGVICSHQVRFRGRGRGGGENIWRRCSSSPNTGATKLQEVASGGRPKLSMAYHFAKTGKDRADP